MAALFMLWNFDLLKGKQFWGFRFDPAGCLGQLRRADSGFGIHQRIHCVGFDPYHAFEKTIFDLIFLKGLIQILCYPIPSSFSTVSSISAFSMEPVNRTGLFFSSARALGTGRPEMRFSSSI